jgi:hypothetical protein
MHVLSDYTGADIYQLTNDDYASTEVCFGFYPDVNATSENSAVLAAQIADPVDGTISIGYLQAIF